MLEKITQKELDELLERGDRYLGDLDLSGLILYKKSADLQNVVFDNSNLSHASLASMYLTGASFVGANLERTNFSMSTLDDTDFTDVKNLDKAYLSWASTEGIDGLTCIGVQVNTSRGNNRITFWKEHDIVTTGCFQGTMAELKAKVLETHRDQPKLLARYNRAIEYIELEATHMDIFEEAE